MLGDSIDSLVGFADRLYQSYADVLAEAKQELDANGEPNPDKIVELVSWVNDFTHIKRELDSRGYNKIESIEICQNYMEDEKQAIIKDSNIEYNKILVLELENKVEELNRNMTSILRLEPIHMETDNDLIVRDSIQDLIVELPDSEVPDDMKSEILKQDKELLRRFKEYEISDADLDSLTYTYYPMEYWWRNPLKIEEGVRRLENKWDWYAL